MGGLAKKVSDADEGFVIFLPACNIPPDWFCSA
jgi:hypothetical protein